VLDAGGGFPSGIPATLPGKFTSYCYTQESVITSASHDAVDKSCLAKTVIS